MAKSRYSEQYIADVKAGRAELPADKGQATYVKRLARNYEAGVSRSQLRGHARTTKGEKPLSVVKVEKKQQKISSPPIKKSIPKTPLAKRNLGQHVKHKRNKQGEIVRSRINARSEETLTRQIEKTADNRSIVFHLINQKNGEEVRAIADKGVTAGDIKEKIADGLAQGKTQKQAVRDAILELFRFYGVDPITGIRTSDEVDGMPDDITNFVMYAE